jgi:hypothetical protein
MIVTQFLTFLIFLWFCLADVKNNVTTAAGGISHNINSLSTVYPGSAEKLFANDLAYSC